MLDQISDISFTIPRFSVASASLNQAKIGLSIAIRYALNRRAFGPANGEEIRLLDYPLHQHRLIPRLASTYVFQFVLNQLKVRWHNQQTGKELHVWSSGFKSLISWHALETLQEAREACGGQGYKSENRIGHLKNTHDIAVTYEGDNHILMQTVAKIMLSEFLKGVKKGGVFDGHFVYLNDRHKLQQVDLSTMDVRSPQFTQIVMRRREAALFAKLASEIENKVRKGMSSTDAFNECAVMVEEAAWAHAELLVVDVFQDAVMSSLKSGEKEIAAMLGMCGALYSLKRIDSQSIFVRIGAVSAKISERVHNTIAQLCRELRPHALHLVDSFGIPVHLLSPIAFDYGEHNSRARL